MIIGRGLLSNALANIDSEKSIFYVNGISNSVVDYIPEDNFEQKEVIEISHNYPTRTFVYFSTIQVNAIENHGRPYVWHKMRMETLVKQVFPNHVIIRTSNLVGRNPWNTHTLFNFLYNCLMQNKGVDVNGSTKRNVLDVDHFIDLTDHYLKNYKPVNGHIDIVNPVSYNMDEILKEFEMVFEKKFIRNHSPISIAKFESSCAFSKILFSECGIEMDNYLNTIIKKYYLPVAKIVH